MISKSIPKRFHISQLKILHDLAKLIFNFFPLCVTSPKSYWAMWDFKIYSGCTFFRVWIKALETDPNHLLWPSRISHSSLCKTTAFYYIYLALSLHLGISYLPIHFSLASAPQVLRDQGWLYLHPLLWISSSQKTSWHWEGVIYSCWIYYWISGCLMKSSPSWPNTQVSPWPVWDGSLHYREVNLTSRCHDFQFWFWPLPVEDGKQKFFVLFCFVLKYLNIQNHKEELSVSILACTSSPFPYPDSTKSSKNWLNPHPAWKIKSQPQSHTQASLESGNKMSSNTNHPSRGHVSCYL